MVTRKDIANKVGVSVSVVSRALNNSGYVKQEKRKEILHIAEEMGYHPNPVAMSLQQKTDQADFIL
jgi:DNA-binding LacI/PurR family transcriptional regulator